MATSAFERRLIELSSRETVFARAQYQWALKLPIPGPALPCLCGRPSTTSCLVLNRINGKWTTIGSCCAKSRMGWDAPALFTGLISIEKDLKKPPRSELVIFCHENHILNDWELDFLSTPKSKSKSSEAQQLKIMQINRKILRDINARREAFAKGLMDKALGILKKSVPVHDPDAPIILDD